MLLGRSTKCDGGTLSGAVDLRGRLLDQCHNRLEKASCRRAVQDAVIECQTQHHLLTGDDLSALQYNRLPTNCAQAENRGFGRVDDGGKRLHTKASKVTDGEDAVL